MKDFFTDLVKKMIARPEALTIDAEENPEAIVFTISAEADDCGRIIGRRGKTINAVKTLLYLYLHKKEPPEKHGLKIVLRVNP